MRYSSFIHCRARSGGRTLADSNGQSANGELPNLQYHLNGLYEMVRRRGGFENGGFSSDLRRLIAW